MKKNNKKKNQISPSNVEKVPDIFEEELERIYPDFKLGLKSKLKSEEPQTKPDQSGSLKYLSNRKFDLIDRQLRKDIKEHEGHKKILILKFAEQYEKAGYECRLICKRISDLLSKAEYNTSSKYVRMILPEKYKDPEQMETAKKQLHDGGNHFRQMGQVDKKENKDITEDDFKFIRIQKAKLAFKYQRDKALWFEEQVKTLKSELEIWHDLKKKINENKLSDSEIVKTVRSIIGDLTNIAQGLGI